MARARLEDPHLDTDTRARLVGHGRTDGGADDGPADRAARGDRGHARGSLLDRPDDVLLWPVTQVDADCVTHGHDAVGVTVPPALVDLELEQRDPLVEQLEPDRRFDVGGPVGHVAGHVPEGRGHGRRAIGAQEVESVGEQFEGAGDGHDPGNEHSARLVPRPSGVTGNTCRRKS